MQEAAAAQPGVDEQAMIDDLENALEDDDGAKPLEEFGDQVLASISEEPKP